MAGRRTAAVRLPGLHAGKHGVAPLARGAALCHLGGCVAVLTKALARLRADFDAAFPGRDKASDGWVGDRAHQASTSGHNPDDTAGSRSEYTDADNTAEVRAVDVDDDLRSSLYVTMFKVVERIIATPADARRLKYVIYAGRIASKSSGWAWRPYSGANPHDKHAHFSGDPEFDDDDRPWVVAQMGADMSLTDGQAKQLADIASRMGYVDARTEAIFNGRPVVVDKQFKNVGEVNRLAARLTELEKALAAVDVPEIDYDKLGDTIAAKLFERAVRGGQ